MLGYRFYFSLSLTILMLSLSACSRIVPASALVMNHPIPAGTEQTYYAALRAAQHENLDVAVIDRASGLIRFEAAALTPKQLDRYARFPVTGASGKPRSTFSGWDSTSRWFERYGPVRGRVSITLLISGSKEKSNVNIRTNWSAWNRYESYACNSTGVYEQEFIASLNEHLSPPR